MSRTPLIIRHTLPYLPDSSDYFRRLRHLSSPVWLDSCQPAARSGRFDIISAAPTEVLTFHQPHDQGCPFSQLNAALNRYDVCTPATGELPFCGGAIGLFGYDLGRTTEVMPEYAENDMRFPDMRVGIYLWALIIDHQTQQCEAVFQPSMEAETRCAILNALECSNTTAHTAPFELTQAFQANVDKATYTRQLTAIDEYIHAGDCYQVNFAQRFSSTYTGDPLDAYLRLRKSAPVPFAAYMEADEGAVLSLSPERFLEVRDGNVSTKPIKGTRPTHADPTQNQAEINDLLNSTKDRAENLMIVDLLRNDLSKACQFGSVKVPALFALESYANVHHLVSTVTGVLDTGHSPVDLLRDCFPGGSITGAPKLRAMEIIEELEPHRRSVYCGSIGYISFCGRMDTSITIRTLLAEQGNIYCWAGGGIVADSDIDEEYQETFNKVNNLLQTLESTLPTQA